MEEILSKLTKELNSIDVSVESKGEVLLSKEFQKGLAKLDGLKKAVSQTEKEMKAKVEEEFEKYEGLEKFGGEFVTVSRSARYKKNLVGDPKELIKDKENKQFVTVDYKPNTKEINAYEKEHGTVPDCVELEFQGFSLRTTVKNGK